mgnify:CR=1 FL=1
MVFIFLKMRRAPSFDSKIILKSDLSREKRQLIEDLKRRRPVVRLPQLSQKGKRVKIEFFLNSGAAAILSDNKKRKNIRIFIVSTELFFYNAV